ncbi:MAG: signal peptidase I [Planctomycetota bacterium]
MEQHYGRIPSKRRRREERSFLSIFTSDMIKAGCVIFLLHLFVIQFSVVRGSSMMPNISDGDRLVVDRLSYNLLDIGRFDVVIMAKTARVDYVKRIVGLPGEKVVIHDGKIWVNGRLLPEPFRLVPDHTSQGEWIVPATSYFVLGDNRPISSDSREDWFVDRSMIKGKVRACIWPFAHARMF